MTRTVLPLAVAGMLAALPALGQQRDIYFNPDDQLALAPVQDVVLAVEQRLQGLGYAVTPDGQFDADLRNSVLLFQSDRGLRPTGNVDLSTLAALGIDVDPTGAATAMVQPQPGDQMAMATDEPPPATAAAPRRAAPSGSAITDWDYPVLRDESMSAPQTAQDFADGTFENHLGIPQPNALLAQDIPGVPPGYVEHGWQ